MSEARRVASLGVNDDQKGTQGRRVLGNILFLDLGVWLYGLYGVTLCENASSVHLRFVHFRVHPCYISIKFIQQNKTVSCTKTRKVDYSLETRFANSAGFLSKNIRSRVRGPEFHQSIWTNRCFSLGLIVLLWKDVTRGSLRFLFGSNESRVTSEPAHFTTERVACLDWITGRSQFLKFSQRWSLLLPQIDSWTLWWKTTLEQTCRKRFFFSGSLYPVSVGFH